MTRLKTIKETKILFTLDQIKDNQGIVRKLSDYSGKKLVVFFYPKASTPGCTAEACNLRDHYQTFQAKGYEILGVSADTEKKQKAFVDKFDFPFPSPIVPLAQIHPYEYGSPVLNLLQKSYRRQFFLSVRPV